MTEFQNWWLVGRKPSHRLDCSAVRISGAASASGAFSFDLVMVQQIREREAAGRFGGPYIPVFDSISMYANQTKEHQSVIYLLCTAQMDVPTDPRECKNSPLVPALAPTLTELRKCLSRPHLISLRVPGLRQGSISVVHSVLHKSKLVNALFRTILDSPMPSELIVIRRNLSYFRIHSLIPQLL